MGKWNLLAEARNSRGTARRPRWAARLGDYRIVGLADISEHKAANHSWMLGCSARTDRLNLCSKKKLQLAQCFGGRFAREFPKVMHHVHLIVVPEFMGDIGPRFR